MKDKQGEPASPQARIPVISDILHFVAMTVVVYLRSSFGFSYLRSKAVFIAFSWAVVLFTVYSWLEPGRWQQFGSLCIFGMGAVVLYQVHLIPALRRETKRQGEHDSYSGTSHLIRWIPPASNKDSAEREMNIHLWAEPGLVLILAFIFRLTGIKLLSSWLFLAAICLFLKELQNYWSELRKEKVHSDMVGDIPKSVKDSGTSNIPAPKATRTAPVKRQRTTVPAEQERHALTLRLIPPYSLEQANTNFKSLIKLAHSDVNQELPEGSTTAAELNKAVEYFREKLGG
jgi:hypothetical protein